MVDAIKLSSADIVRKAKAEVDAEQKEKATKELVKLYRSKAQAEEVVKGIDRQIEVYVAALGE